MLQTFDLTLVSRAAQLMGQLVALGKTGGAQRVTLGQQAARRIDHHLAAVGVVAIEHELLGAAFRAEAQAFVGQQFVMGEAVVQFADADILRADPGFLVDLGGRLTGHADADDADQRRWIEGVRLIGDQRLGELFLDTAQRLRALVPGVRFVSPCANPTRRAQLEQMLVGRDLPLTLLDGQSHQALAACDAVLIASGTATLEALLYKRPMVVAYRLAPLTYWILKRLVKSPYVSLPNLLAQRELVPELLQDDATSEALAQTLASLVADGSQQTERFDEIHRTLRRDASNQAAEAVLALLKDR